MAVTLPFQWGPQGQALTPDQVKQRRSAADALLSKSDALPTDLWSGLNSVTNALVGNTLGQRADEAQQAGVDSGNAAFAGLADGSGSNADIIAALSNPWVANDPSKSAIAQALLQQNMKASDPMTELSLKQAQLNYDQDLAGPSSTGPDAPSSVREWEYYNALPDDQKSDYLRMKRSNPYLDLGTGFAQPDPVNPGQTAGDILPKDNQGAAYATAYGGVEGKTEAENAAAAQSVASKLPGLESVVSQLGELAKTATYTQTGQLVDNVTRELGGEMSPAAIARAQYIAMVDNQVLPLLRDTFGAAFTQKEGETLRNTLGAPDKSPIEKQAILNAFIEQKKRDVAAMQSNLPGGSPLAPPVGAVTPPPVIRVFNPATGRLE